MGNTNLWDVITATLEKANTPLTPKEIWEKASHLGTMGDFSTSGKTPWATIAAYCYTNLNSDSDKSRVVKTSERPTRFYLRKLVGEQNIKVVTVKKKGKEIDEKLVTEDPQEEEIPVSFKELDLHPLLVAYAKTNQHFRCHVKTIHAENSAKGAKGQNEWLHPDLVGVYFPFDSYVPEILDVQKHLSVSSIRLFSFEMKIALSFGNLRKYFFQAVSNSSWAHEGYLVALRIDEDATFRDELRRLSNAFGIGVIQLNPSNLYESEILLPAEIKTEVDWETADRLAGENKDFQEFLQLIAEDSKLGKVKSHYDESLTPEKAEQYVKEKGIA
jgi:uncharacterized protein